MCREEYFDGKNKSEEEFCQIFVLSDQRSGGKCKVNRRKGHEGPEEK